MLPPPTLEWKPDSADGPIPGKIRMIDQTLLPTELTWIELDTPESIVLMDARYVNTDFGAPGSSSDQGSVTDSKRRKKGRYVRRKKGRALRVRLCILLSLTRSLP